MLDTTLSAQEIAKAFAGGLLNVDPERRRGKTRSAKTSSRRTKSSAGPENFRRRRRSSADSRRISDPRAFLPDRDDKQHGPLILSDGSAYLPDSVHRHRDQNGVDSIAQGSSFDPGRRFSVRIWRVSEEFENKIFY